jgi:CRISPR-associated endonuclease/helicase Cas3
MSADPQSFPDSFCSSTGYSPMRWQNRLFGQLINCEVPAALDLPTGLGKTSVMAIWLVARALAGEDILKAIPRQLVYIVDRRAVVDQATEEAEKLRQALNSNAAHLKIPLGLSLGDRRARSFDLRPNTGRCKAASEGEEAVA